MPDTNQEAKLAAFNVLADAKDHGISLRVAAEEAVDAAAPIIEAEVREELLPLIDEVRVAAIDYGARVVGAGARLHGAENALAAALNKEDDRG